MLDNEDIQTDESLAVDWAKLINELQSRHVTLERIASECKISLRMVSYLKSGDFEPSFGVGMRLVELHRKYVPRET